MFLVILAEGGSQTGTQTSAVTFERIFIERIFIEDYHWVNTNDGFSLNFGLNFMNFAKCPPTLEVCNFSNTDPFSKFLVSILSSSICNVQK